MLAVPIRVAVYAADPISHGGLLEQVERCPQLELTATGAQVLIAVVEESPAELPDCDLPVVLVGDHDLDVPGLLAYQVMAMLPEAALTPARLARIVLSVAAGGATLPPTLVGDLVRHLRRGVPRLAVGLSTREIDVLQLIADGCSTAEIAAKLSYSERTVKAVVRGLTDRLGLRNRCHAVAYALRHRLI